MELHNILEYAPIVMAVMVGFNAILFGIYSACGKLCEQAKGYPSNLYLQAGARVACSIMKVLDVLGYHPLRPTIKKAILKNKMDIQKLKQKVKK